MRVSKSRELIEHDFLPDYHHAVRGGVNRFASLLSLSVAAFVACFVLWAHHAKLDEVTPDIAANAKDFYDTQIIQLKTALAVFNDQLTQHAQEVLELRSKEQSLVRAVDLAKQERAITAPLVEKGSAPRIELIRLDRSIADLEGQLSATWLSIPRAEAARDEVKRRMDEKIATFRSEVSTDLAKRRTDLAAVTEKISAEQDRVTRTEVRSPVRGTIKQIKINTIGGVIRPGEDLPGDRPTRGHVACRGQGPPFRHRFPSPRAIGDGEDQRL